MLQTASKNAKTSLTTPAKTALAIASLVVLAPLTAHAVPLVNLGTAGDYAIVYMAPASTGDELKINSGPVVGRVLVGNGAKVDTSGGNDGAITGGAFIDNTVTGDTNFGGLNTPPTVTIVSTAVTQAALASAEAAAAVARTLVPTQTFLSTINSTTTITGNGGNNVISLVGVKNAELTIKGTASDFFVFNVSDTVDTNEMMTLDGISASQILWNFLPSAQGQVLNTAGGNRIFGTFLATEPGQRFQFSNLRLDGALINTEDAIQFVSGSQLNGVTLVPEPTSALLLALGIAGLGYAKRKSLFAR